MAYFQDLSDYSYDRAAVYRPVERNIGWLGLEHKFEKQEPSEELLELIWSFCRISVSRTRGIHQCEFCSDEDWYISTRNGQRLKLGNAEIRVFSKDGIVYAAPNLIYHYVSVHHYRPPNEFIQALNEGPRPFNPDYFAQIEKLGYEWQQTYSPDADWDSAIERIKERNKSLGD